MNVALARIRQVDRIGADPIDGDDLQRRQQVGHRVGQPERAAAHDAADGRAVLLQEDHRVGLLMQSMDPVAPLELRLEGRQ